MSSQSKFDDLDLGDITASLVVDDLGSATGPDGTSRGVGNQTDFELLVYLRRRSEVVLTSGLTALRENYKMPKAADLAILTSRSPEDFDIPSNQANLLFVSGGYIPSFQALRGLGYMRIHTEFGPAGFSALAASNEVDAVLSSLSQAGLEAFCNKQELEVETMLQFEELHIARVAGRGNG